MRKSKFIGLQNCGYTCTGIGVADVQSKLCRKKITADGKKAKTKSPYSKQYNYFFEKFTSDGKAIKSIILSADQARKVYRGLATVDEYVKRKERKRSQLINFKERINYSFCD